MDTQDSIATRLGALANGADSLPANQGELLRSIARRNDYQAMLIVAMRNGAIQKLKGIEEHVAVMKQELGWVASPTGSAHDTLTLLGAMREGDDLSISARTSQFPDGVWVKCGASLGGIQAIEANLNTKRGAARYLGTHWNLPIGPRHAPEQALREEHEAYIEWHTLGYILPQMKGAKSLTSFFKEVERTRTRLQDIKNLCADGAPGPEAWDQLMANPNLYDVVREDTWLVLTSAEQFRQAVLARSP